MNTNISGKFIFGSYNDVAWSASNHYPKQYSVTAGSQSGGKV